MFCSVVNAWSIDFASVEGADETPPLGIAALLVAAGLDVTTFVGAGLGVLVGAGVAVGTGVSVGGKGVAVGADAPTGNLDSRTGDAIFDLLVSLNQQLGITVVLVTHNESMALRIPRRITLTDGRMSHPPEPLFPERKR